MPSKNQADLLAHAQRDTRLAVFLHALLLIALIVLWAANLRLGFLAPVESTLVRVIFGSP